MSKERSDGGLKGAFGVVPADKASIAHLGAFGKHFLAVLGAVLDIRQSRLRSRSSASLAGREGGYQGGSKLGESRVCPWCKGIGCRL